jgi:hypothetical protein
MIGLGVFGQFGSGCKFLSRGLAVALTGAEDFRDEPIIGAGVYRPWLETRIPTLRPALMKFFRGLRDKDWPLVKDHFVLPEYMETFSEMGAKCLYLQRRTLGNVQYLLQWEGVDTWLWYHEAILEHNPGLVLALWPEGVATDYIPAKLAVAHTIQCREDRQAARQFGVPVFSGEDFFAEWSVAWPALFMELEIEPRPEFDAWLSTNRIPPEFPYCTDKRMLEVVREVERRSEDLP